MLLDTLFKEAHQSGLQESGLWNQRVIPLSKNAHRQVVLPEHMRTLELVSLLTMFGKISVSVGW